MNLVVYFFYAGSPPEHPHAQLVEETAGLPTFGG